MQKTRAIIYSFIWAVVLIAFPVVSGVIVVVSKADAVSSRLIQTAFMCISLVVPLAYCKAKNISPRELLLTGIDKSGLRACLFYLPLVVILLPMIVAGVDLSNLGYTLATLLFTLSVGVAEELYFRGVILRLLRKDFSALQAVLVSLLIFGIGHASGAFVEHSLVMVLLTILNALLFGWVAAETALLSKNIIPLMVFHWLFDFLTYRTLATGGAMITVYAVRGTLMTIVAVYLLIALTKKSSSEPLSSTPGASVAA